MFEGEIQNQNNSILVTMDDIFMAVAALNNYSDLEFRKTYLVNLQRRFDFVFYSPYLTKIPSGPSVDPLGNRHIWQKFVDNVRSFNIVKIDNLNEKH